MRIILILFEEDFTDEIASLKQFGVGDPIEDLFALFETSDNLVFPQDLEVLTEIGLGEIEHLLDFTHRERMIPKQMNNL